MTDAPDLLPVRRIHLVVRDRLAQDDLIAGQSDVAIRASARTAYERVRRLLPEPDPARNLYLTSPVRRAQQTAARIQGDLTWTPQDALRPRDMGNWEGIAWTDVRASDPRRCERFWSDHATAAAPGGERLTDVKERAEGWLAGLLNRDGWDHAVVVTHPTVVRVALCQLLEIPLRHALTLTMDPLAITRLSHSWLGWRLDGLNLQG